MAIETTKNIEMVYNKVIYVTVIVYYLNFPMIGHLERTVSLLGNRKNSLRNILVDTLINGQDDNWIPVTPSPLPRACFYVHIYFDKVVSLSPHYDEDL